MSLVSGPSATRRPLILIRAAGRDPGVVAVEDAITGYFVEAAALLGVPKSVAAIYGICFASADPLSFSDIHERLDLSAGSVSQGLKLLREIGALKVADDRDLGKAETLTAGPAEFSTTAESISACQRVSVSAFQKAATRYAPDLELRRLAQHFLAKRVQPQLASGRDRLTAIVGAMDAGPVRARLEHLANWHAKADALLPLVTSFLEIPTSDSAPA